jgi:hypothetical protein
MSKAGKTSKNDSPFNSEKSSSNRKTTIYKCKDINLKNFVVSELKDEGAQPLAYINYLDPNLKAETKILVQSGKFKLTGHGIPRLSKPDDKYKYYETDDKREFIKLPLDPEFPACNELRELFEKVDEHFASEEFRKKLFGTKKYKKYQYQKCIRTPQSADDEDSEEESGSEDEGKTKNSKNKKDAKGNKKADGKKYPVLDFIKMKFNIIPTDSGRINRTKITKLDGKKKIPVSAKTITEIANEIRFLSELRVVFYFNKVWANKTQTGGMYMYGVGIKVMAIEYTPSVSRGINPDHIEFSSDDEDNEEDETNNSSEKKSKSKPKSKPKFDSDSDGDKSEEEKEVKAVKGSKTKPKPKPESDEDNESEEEHSAKATKSSKSKTKEESSKKSKGKNAKKEPEDEEDEVEDGEVEDDDEAEVEVKSSKGSKKAKESSSKSKSKNSKKVVDEEEEDEEITPKKKVSKGKSSSKSR